MAGLQLTFPYGDAVPAHVGEAFLVAYVTCTVACYLVSPELTVGSGQSEVAAVCVPMPETSVHEDACAVLAQHYVWVTGQSVEVQAVSEPMCEEILAHDELGLRVLAVYCRHVVVALLLAHRVHIMKR